jgi:hypothetical protein
MKTKLLYTFNIDSIIYITVYLLKSYYYWELTNPFEWLINIGTYSSDTRLIIFFITILFFYVIYAWVDMQKDKKKYISN